MVKTLIYVLHYLLYLKGKFNCPMLGKHPVVAWPRDRTGLRPEEKLTQMLVVCLFEKGTWCIVRGTRQKGLQSNSGPMFSCFSLHFLLLKAIWLKNNNNNKLLQCSVANSGGPL